MMKFSNMSFKEILLQMDRKIYYYDCLGSTNDQARILAEEGAGDGSLVIAEMQNAGKGRMGRSFFSPAGSGIWMSLILKPDILPEKASMLTLVAALAVQETMMDFHIPSGIKWPNDIVVQGKKVTGILTEMQAEPGHIDYVILGVGINVNMKDFPDALETVATSMAQVTGKEYDRSQIVKSFLTHFDTHYQRFIHEGNLEFLRQTYNQYLIHRNKHIHVHEIKHIWSGISTGITSEGELIVKRDDEDVFVCSGEVSIRGVYGYME